MRTNCVTPGRTNVRERANVHNWDLFACNLIIATILLALRARARPEAPRNSPVLSI